MVNEKRRHTYVASFYELFMNLKFTGLQLIWISANSFLSNDYYKPIITDVFLARKQVISTYFP